MPKIDWTPEPESSFGKPGVYLARIEKAEARTAKSGAPYFNVVLLAEEWPGQDGKPRFLCYDVITIGGNGRHIGLGKLKALGFTDQNTDIEPFMLKDRLAWVWIGKEMDDRSGKVRRRVDLVFEFGFHGGYAQATAEPQAGWPVVKDEKTPF